MEPEIFAEAPELGLARVLFAEVERLLRDRVVELFHARIRTQKFEALAVRIPEELDPRRQNRPVRAVLCVLKTFFCQNIFF